MCCPPLRPSPAMSCLLHSSIVGLHALTRNSVLTLQRSIRTSVLRTYSYIFWHVRIEGGQIVCPMARSCREAFDLFDTDGSGTIDAKELKVAMRYAQVLIQQFGYPLACVHRNNVSASAGRVGSTLVAVFPVSFFASFRSSNDLRCIFGTQQPTSVFSGHLGLSQRKMRSRK